MALTTARPRRRKARRTLLLLCFLGLLLFTSFASFGWLRAIASLRRAQPAPPPLSVFSGKRAYVLSHEMSPTGAPRVCVELALLLSGAGARVTIAVPPGGEGTGTADALASRAAEFGPGTERLHFDSAASVAAAAANDLIIVSTVDPRQLAWIEAFRDAHPHFPALVWWVHEGAAVTSVFAPAVKARALALMAKPGMLNSLIFPSAGTREWWLDALRASSPATPLPATRFVHWGLPRWRKDSFAAAARNGAERAALRASLGAAVGDFVFLVIASYHPIKGHAGIARAFCAARATCARPLRLVTTGEGLGKEGHFPQLGLEWVRADPGVRLEGPTRRVAAYLRPPTRLLSNTKAGGETWGLGVRVFEALAAACRPVRASRIGGATKMLKAHVTALLHSIMPSVQMSGRRGPTPFCSHVRSCYQYGWVKGLPPLARRISHDTLASRTSESR
jgi:glycosyltransferase involved in cell wall biosynthesis